MAGCSAESGDARACKTGLRSGICAGKHDWGASTPQPPDRLFTTEGYPRLVGLEISLTGFKIISQRVDCQGFLAVSPDTSGSALLALSSEDYTKQGHKSPPLLSGTKRSRSPHGPHQHGCLGQPMLCCISSWASRPGQCGHMGVGRSRNFPWLSMQPASSCPLPGCH